MQRYCIHAHIHISMTGHKCTGTRAHVHTLNSRKRATEIQALPSMCQLGQYLKAELSRSVVLEFALKCQADVRRTGERRGSSKEAEPS